MSCNDLLNLNIFKNINLVAGENGIYNIVSWPYICQTLDFYQWVNGGEFMFLSGMGMDLNDDKLKKLIYDCVKKEISGLVILTNSEYIATISECVKEVADEVGLPLFEMPWNIKLIDVTKEIANYIMELNLSQTNEMQLLKELLFSQDLDQVRINNLINQSKLSLNKYFFIAQFKLLEQGISLDSVMNRIKCKIDKSKINSVFCLDENVVICMVGLNRSDDFDSSKKIVISSYKQISKSIKLSLSMGNLYDDILCVKCSYDQARKAFNLYQSNDWDLSVIDYERLGFYKILFGINDKRLLRTYCQDILGEIVESERNSHLLKTLRFYLKNNCNLIHTSQDLFIHRNTLIYRLNKIKEILDGNFEDPLFKNELMNAIMIYDYLKYEQ
ncbi:MAG: PucR family transcriptional regulator [Turicibacter sp.]